jgi:hypothetical protein
VYEILHQPGLSSIVGPAAIKGKLEENMQPLEENFIPFK